MAIKYRILPIGGGGGITPSGTIEITENGLHDVREYASASVDVSAMSSNPVCFTARQNNTSLKFENYGTNINTTKPFFLYSLDGVNYYPYNTGYFDGETHKNVITITLSNAGDKVYFVGFNPNGISYANTDYNYGDNYTTLLVSSGSVTFSGDLTTLLDPKGGLETIPVKAFVNLFQDTNYTLYGSVDLHTVKRIENNAMIRTFQDTSITSVDLSNLESVAARGLSAAFARADIQGNLDLSSLTTVYNENALWCCFLNNNLTSVDLSNLTSVSGYHAFYWAFNGNSNLNEVKIAVTTWDTNIYDNWLFGVASTGTFINLGGATIQRGASGIPLLWQEINHSLIDFDFNASTATLSMASSIPNSTIYYTTDGTTPTTASNVYASPVYVGDAIPDYTFKAIATDGEATSQVNSTTINIDVYDIHYSVEDNILTINTLLPNSTVYYTTDGTTPTTASMVYSSPLSVQVGETVKSFATDGTIITPIESITVSIVSQVGYIHTDPLNTQTLIDTGIPMTSNMSWRVKGRFIEGYRNGGVTVGQSDNRSGWRFFLHGEPNYYDLIEYQARYSIGYTIQTTDIDYTMGNCFCYDNIISTYRLNTSPITPVGLGNNLKVDVGMWWLKSLEVFDDNGVKIFDGYAAFKDGVYGLYDSSTQQLLTPTGVTLVGEN